MKTSKPEKLISLLEDFISTDDKPTIGRLYKEIAVETMTIRFVDLPNEPFIGLVYKKLVQLAIKAYVNEERSEQSIKDLQDTVEILSNSEIFIH